MTFFDPKAIASSPSEKNKIGFTKTEEKSKLGNKMREFQPVVQKRSAIPHAQMVRLDNNYRKNAHLY